MISPIVELAAAAASGHDDLMSIVLRNLPAAEQAEIAKFAASSGLRPDDPVWLFVGATIWTHKDAEFVQNNQENMELTLQEAVQQVLKGEIGKILKAQTDHSLVEFSRALRDRVEAVADRAGTLLFSKVGFFLGAVFLVTGLVCVIGGMMLGQQIERMTPCGYVHWRQHQSVYMCRAPDPDRNPL